MTTNAVATVVPLRQAGDAWQAGTKAATLAMLAAQGFPVPEGVVIPASLFLKAVRASAEPVSDTLAVPSEVLAALGEAIRPWGEVALAVRSSAADEDLGASSYAGLYTSVLGVCGEEALAVAVLRCWTSAFAERVTAHAAAAGPFHPKMAVLVQPMVAAVAAGVAFTADPVTGERDVVLIDAVPGLADRLVSGEVTPERWTVRAGRAERRPRADAAEALDGDLALAVADLARRVARCRGHTAGHRMGRGRRRRGTATGAPDHRIARAAPVPVPVEVPPGYWTREAEPCAAAVDEAVPCVLESRVPAAKAAFDEHRPARRRPRLARHRRLEYLRIVPLGGKDPTAAAGLGGAAARSGSCPCCGGGSGPAVAAMRGDVPMRLIRPLATSGCRSSRSRIATLRDVDLGALDDDRLDHAPRCSSLFDDG